MDNLFEINVRNTLIINYFNDNFKRTKVTTPFDYLINLDNSFVGLDLSGYR